MQLNLDIPQLLERLHAAAGRVQRSLAFMEVCGTHTVAGFRTGLHATLPANVKLLSGPGCPVCVTAQGDIDLMIDAALDCHATLCTYGDMLKVPGTRGSLEYARGRGAKVKVIYSTLDAVKLAEANPQEQFVLGAVGFETTTPATAVAVLEASKRGLENFTVLASHKVLLPALRALLDGGEVKVDGFLCPGHASVVLGAEAFRQLVTDYAMPCVIAGFDARQMLAGMVRLTEMAADNKPDLDNVYPQVVKDQGNLVAQGIIEKVFEAAPAKWRALGEIPGSGLRIRDQYAHYDAIRRFGLKATDAPEPAGCRCGEVITGRCSPADCGLFRRKCTPLSPVGPCMVSSEGTCAAWFKYGPATKPTEVGV
jgi:hydrogenase expression/formation protein HypD